MKKIVSSILLALLIISALSLAFSIKPARAEWTGTVYIRADGSIDPSDAPITTYDNITYSLTDNITSSGDGIVVEKDNIIIDGTCYTLRGDEGSYSNGIHISGRSNITLRSFKIENFGLGILIYNSSNIKIYLNNIYSNKQGVYIDRAHNNYIRLNNISANYYCGIVLSDSQNNVFIENDIVNNGWYAVFFQSLATIEPSDNKFYHNNFVGNTQIYFATGWGIEPWENIWDNGYPSGGNYWSDYVGSDEKCGPDQDQPGSDGIGDTPYNIAENNVDNYPLMNPWVPYEHDLAVALNVRRVLMPGESVTLNATVTNLGLMEEVGVEFMLILNGTIVKSVIVPELAVEQHYTLSFEWTPTIEGLYNITTYALPVAGEEFVANNVETILVKVTTIITTAIIVPDDYPTIQEAIDAADPGDFIFVRAGTYYENVILNKPLLLMGESAIIEGSYTTIDGGGKGYVVTINVDGVNMTGFTIQKSGEWYAGICLQDIKYCNISKNVLTKNHRAGILLKNSSYNIICENWIIANKLNGIFLRESSNNQIFKNNVVKNAKWGSCGIWIYEGSHNSIFENNLTKNFHGIVLSSSSYNNITQNIVEDNSYDGILIVGSLNNTIKENMVKNNSDGIHLGGSTHNTVTGNTIFANRDSGVSLVVAKYNNISANTFIKDGVYAAYFGEDIKGNIIKDNTVNGKPIIYYENMSEIIIEGEVGQVILVSCENITIRNLTISCTSCAIQLLSTNNTSILNTLIADNRRGIKLSGSANNSVFGNNITKNNGYGIYLCCSSSNIIARNIVDSCETGVSLEDSLYNNVSNNIIVNNEYGVELWYSCNNNMIQNNIAKNTYGIYLVNSFNNIMLRNNIASNQHGLTSEDSNNNTISENNIVANNQWGVYLYYSSNNKFYHNNFIDNTDHVYKPPWIEPSPNIWDDGYPSGGNYWSDYTGVDLKSGPYQNLTRSDGIGDAAYEIDVNNKDDYPLMAPFTAFDAGIWNGVAYDVEVVSNSTVSGFYFNPDEGAFLRFNVTGDDGTAGFCRVAIPKSLLWVEDGWTITVGDQPITDYVEMEDENFTYLYFTYNHTTKTVTIQGTHVIPELPPSQILPLLITLSAITLVLAKKKTGKKT